MLIDGSTERVLFLLFLLLNLLLVVLLWHHHLLLLPMPIPTSLMLIVLPVSTLIAARVPCRRAVVGPEPSHPEPTISAACVVCPAVLVAIL